MENVEAVAIRIIAMLAFFLAALVVAFVYCVIQGLRALLGHREPQRSRYHNPYR